MVAYCLAACSPSATSDAVTTTGPSHESRATSTTVPEGQAEVDDLASALNFAASDAYTEPGRAQRWQPVLATPEINLPDGNNALAVVNWVEFPPGPANDSDEPNYVEDLAVFGPCDDQCQATVGAQVNTLVISDLPTSIRSESCVLCTFLSHLSVFEFDGDTVRALIQQELVNAFAPIDTPYEVSLLVDRTDQVRRDGSDWRVVSARPEDPFCWPSPTFYTLWSLRSEDGVATRLAGIDVPVGADADVTCE